MRGARAGLAALALAASSAGLMGAAYAQPALSADEATAAKKLFMTKSCTACHGKEGKKAIQDYPELARHDPFDRLLVAQADRAGLRLLTADRVLLGLQRSFILDATK